MKSICVFFLLVGSSLLSLAQMPNFNFPDTNGTNHLFYNSIRDGKLVILDFYFVGCGACIDVAQRLHEVDKKYGLGNEGLQILSMEVQNNPVEAVEEWESSLPGTYPVLIGDGPWNYWADHIFTEFGGSFPQLILVKGNKDNPSDNEVLYSSIGQFGASGQAALEAKIDENIVQRSIGEIKQASIVQLLNNPAKGFLSFKFSNDLQTENIQFELFGLDGQSVQKWEGFDTRKDISQLPTGQYLLNINTDANHQQTLKVLIVK